MQNNKKVHVTKEGHEKLIEEKTGSSKIVRLVSTIVVHDLVLDE